jgi:hypothetical protein
MREEENGGYSFYCIPLPDVLAILLRGPNTNKQVVYQRKEIPPLLCCASISCINITVSQTEQFPIPNFQISAIFFPFPVLFFLSW